MSEPTDEQLGRLLDWLDHKICVEVYTARDRRWVYDANDPYEHPHSHARATTIGRTG